MSKKIGISMVSVMIGLAGIASADTKFTSHGNASGFQPHFFTTLGVNSWRNYNESLSKSAVDEALQDGAPASFTFDGATELKLVTGVGMRPTERIAIEIQLNALPSVDYSERAMGSDEVVEGNTLGWNAKLAAKYAFPIGGSGLKALASTGYSHSNVNTVTIRRAIDPDSSLQPTRVRTSKTWRDPFISFGLSLPIPVGNNNWEVSFMFSRIFTDEESVNQVASAQMVYNFK